MQLLASAEEMHAADQAAIKTLGIPGSILMENAGRAFVDELARRVAPLAGRNIVVVCGKGNNGGDGFVIARQLLSRGCVVTVALLCKRHEVQGDARANLDILLTLQRRRVGSLGIVSLSSESRWPSLGKPDVVVDAIFGTGFKGRARGLSLKAIKWINGGKSLTASVDICSGINASTGAVDGEAVKAHFTVAMGLAKIGQFVGAGREHSGEVVVADISIPNQVMHGKTFRVTAQDIRLPKRSLTAHKYSVGKVFVLAGSRKFTGAPVLCAKAAMRAGAGAVILGAPKSIQRSLVRKLTEVIIVPFDETNGGSLALSSYNAVMERCEWADVVAIGPGLSREPDTLDLIRKLILHIKKPLVVDADALAAIAVLPQALRRRKSSIILTPHAGELGVLRNQDSKVIEAERVEACRSAAQSLQSVVCLKGSPTITATPDGKAYVNTTGNPGMATIGSGDVLTGVIASLQAQGLQAVNAALAGVFIHGLAGDVATSKLGERSVMALDILDCISHAMRALDGR